MFVQKYYIFLFIIININIKPLYVKSKIPKKIPNSEEKSKSKVPYQHEQWQIKSLNTYNE